MVMGLQIIAQLWRTRLRYKVRSEALPLSWSPDGLGPPALATTAGFTKFIEDSKLDIHRSLALNILKM